MLNVVRLSAGSAAALGLDAFRRDVEVGTVYAMVGRGPCPHGCSFCPQGHPDSAACDRLSRVVWPAYPVDGVLRALRDHAPEGDGPRRLCLQVIGGEDGLADARRFLDAYRATGGGLPVSVNAAVSDRATATALLEAGVERLGLALDAATPALFRRHKGGCDGGWEARMCLIETLARVHRDRISTHFIVGLGETEEELVAAMARAIGAGATVALFAFTPVRGTRLAAAAPPDPGHYRRMQLARQLLVEGRATTADFAFVDGRLRALEVPIAPSDVARAIRTSGCPDCNRPYYNERPGETPYNYPRPPSDREVRGALATMALSFPGSVGGRRREHEACDG